MDFEALYKATEEKYTDRQLPTSLLALDPGETTGWALFGNQHLIKCGQINTSDFKWAVQNLEGLFQTADILPTPYHVVCEDYRVYQWKAKAHTNAPLITPRLIGVIETLCAQREIEPSKQMAVVAKGFCTDEKLREWGFYQKTLNPALKHARDAIRHGAYYLLFNKDKPDGDRRPAEANRRSEGDSTGAPLKDC